MAWYLILLLCLGGLVLLCLLWILALASFGAHWACYPARHSRERCLQHDIEHGFYSRTYAEDLIKSGQPFSVNSPGGYRLCAMRFLKRGDSSSGVVILAHGFGCSMYTSFRYVALFQRLGFDCVIYDQPYHGESGGKFCTMGGLETGDLLVVAEEVRRSYPAKTVIGLHGESMGAATVLNALDSGFPFSFCIEDCGFGSAAEQARHLIQRYTLLFRRPVFCLMRYMIFRKTGVDYETVSPIRTVASENAAKIPVLFIHGEEDRFVPYKNLKQLYNSKKGPKSIYSVPGAKHAEALRVAPAGYDRAVRSFLKQYRIPCVLKSYDREL